MQSRTFAHLALHDLRRQLALPGRAIRIAHLRQHRREIGMGPAEVGFEAYRFAQSGGGFGELFHLLQH